MRLSPQSQERLRRVADAHGVSITVLVEKALRSVAEEMGSWTREEILAVKRELAQEGELDQAWDYFERQQQHPSKPTRRI